MFGALWGLGAAYGEVGGHLADRNGWLRACGPIGMTGTIGALIVWSWTARNLDFRLAQPIAVAGLGFAAGAFAMAVSTARTIASLAQNGDEYGYGKLDASPAWTLGVIGLIVGVVFAVVAVIGGLLRARTMRLQARIRSGGTQVRATVSDQGYTHFGEGPRMLAKVTFTFRDEDGMQRWVQRTMVVDARKPVVTGQATRLWYDPDSPSDKRSIVIELVDR